jgi:hypothetical protein
MLPPPLGSNRCHDTTYTITESIVERITNRPVVQAFHATNLKAFRLILESGGFRCGEGGMLGPGIYFCPRPTDCILKSVQDPEVLFDVDLQLGKIRVQWYGKNQHVQHRDEFDSILSRNHPDVSLSTYTGIEFMVFRPSQITIRNVYLLKPTLNNLRSELVSQYLPLSAASHLNEFRYQSFERINRWIEGGWEFTRVTFPEALCLELKQMVRVGMIF